MHTTASDGRCSPDDLVARVHAAGLTTFAITDHDTVAALPEARAAAMARGLTLVAGIEITAVSDAADVHVLGYWCDETDGSLLAFLAEQRARRLERVERIAHALARAGAPIDVTPLLEDAAARPGAAVGRPGLARALVDAGHAASVQDAFDRLLGVGCPAYVARAGVSPEEVFAIVHAAGGLASLAHPGVTRRDDRLDQWVRGGLDALEAFHSDQPADEQARYLEAAARLGIAVSGGSDFHGDDPMSDRASRRAVGGVTLPVDRWEALQTAHAVRRR
ncbi:MAG: PHP domain-containing protein [Acidobacteria bacterium]|nr:PHP domain-containing protein [Acidobacteriota bacterium]